MPSNSDNNSFYESDPDVLLMLAFQQGDYASFESLMRKYYKRIFHFLCRMLGDRDAAEDVSQEVFLRVYQSAPKYRSNAKFQTWLYTIAKNLALNELRRQKRPMVSLDAEVSSDGGQMMRRQIADEKGQDPSERIRHLELVEAVKNAIEKLPENQRMAVILYRYEQMSYEEIAKSLEISLSAVKSLLSRARESLRKQLSSFINLNK